MSKPLTIADRLFLRVLSRDNLTMSEAADIMGVSENRARAKFVQLCRQGYLERDTGRARAYRVRACGNVVVSGACKGCGVEHFRLSRFCGRCEP